MKKIHSWLEDHMMMPCVSYVIDSYYKVNVQQSPKVHNYIASYICHTIQKSPKHTHKILKPNVQ